MPKIDMGPTVETKNSSSPSSGKENITRRGDVGSYLDNFTRSGDVGVYLDNFTLAVCCSFCCLVVYRL